MRESRNTQISAVTERGWVGGQRINWEGVSILDREKQWNRRKHLKSFHILQRRPSINRELNLCLEDPDIYELTEHL